jgi:hypothetical protein
VTWPSRWRIECGHLPFRKNEKCGLFLISSSILVSFFLQVEKTFKRKNGQIQEREKKKMQ